MKKNALIKKIARDAAIPNSAASRAINTILSGVIEGLKQNQQVSLGDFGTFKLSVNEPQENQSEDNKTIHFSPNIKLRNSINKSE
jgi:nucleoid DNA-binding protein